MNSSDSTIPAGGNSIATQVEAFAGFALIVLLLGSFSKTHMIAVFLIGFLALAITLKFLSGGYK